MESLSAGSKQLISARMKKTDQTEQSSVDERRAGWSAARQQGEVGLLDHAQEGGTHRVGQLRQFKRPARKTGKRRWSRTLREGNITNKLSER